MSVPQYQYQTTLPTYTQYQTHVPLKQSRSVSTTSLNSQCILGAGILGTIVGGTSAMGANLHKVQDKEITMAQAAVDSLVKGAGAGVATAAGAGVASAVGGGSFLSLTFMVVAATGVNYVLNAVGKKVTSSEKS
ncbi:conserved hypothetical protein [Candidatus Magnetomoraceae bacterium gMMP-15]